MFQEVRKYLLSPFTEKETTRNIRWMSRKMIGYVGAQKSCFHQNYMVYDEVSFMQLPILQQCCRTHFQSYFRVTEEEIGEVSDSFPKLDSCKELRTCHFLLCLFFNVLSNFTLARVFCFLGNGVGQMLSLSQKLKIDSRRIKGILLSHINLYRFCFKLDYSV